MHKPTKKRNNYNEDIPIKLYEMYGYSKDYIRKCLRDDRVGIMPDKIKKSYKELENAAKEAIQKAVISEQNAVKNNQ